MLRLYASLHDPFCQRVLIGKTLRGIEAGQLDVDFISASHPPSEVLQLNPAGTLPVLDVGRGKGIADSNSINFYLDSEIATGPRIFGETPYMVSRNLALLTCFEQEFIPEIEKLTHSLGNELALREAYQEMECKYTFLDAIIEQEVGPFFGGERLNAVDAGLVPFLLELFALHEINSNIPLPASQSATGKYMIAAVHHPIVQLACPSLEEITRQLRFAHERDLGAENVHKATRILLERPEEAVVVLNEKIAQIWSDFTNRPPAKWTLLTDSRGNYLEAVWSFRDPLEALRAVRILAEVQESTNHHAACELRDFSTLRIQICTHMPQRGVSFKDVAFVECLETRMAKLTGEAPVL